jgi:2-dehydro-3-deoxygalactonokinase
MRPSPIRWVAALDGGTTNTRARLLHEGRVVAVARRSVGVRDTVLSDGPAALAAAVRDALAEVLRGQPIERPDRVVAAGMLSSEVGLAAVPHVVAPAGPDELARHAEARSLPDVSPWPILFIPGVRTPPAPGADGWATADVMRGEECETLGAWSLLEGAEPAAANRRTVFVWPGSHTKVVEVDGQGRILRSHTSLAGELTAALARHTLLKASLPETLPEQPDLDAVALGARLAGRDGLGRAAFLVRVAALGETLDPAGRAGFLIGAVIADDAANLARHSIFDGPARVWVGGREPQRSLYAAMLRGRIEPPVLAIEGSLAEDASARGAWDVALRMDADAGDRREGPQPDSATG